MAILKTDSVISAGTATSARSIKDILNFTKNVGRCVVVPFGDSTCRRDGAGFGYALHKAFGEYTTCAGYIVPFNSFASYDENFNGMVGIRRRNNNSIKTGCDGDSAAGRPIPSFWNDYYFACNGTTLWEGPQPVYFGRTTLTVAILIGDAMSGSGVLTVTDTSAFPNSGTVRIDNEAFSYTGKTSTTFTGVTRALYAGLGGGGLAAAAAHSIAADVALMYNDSNLQFNIKNSEGVNPNSAKTLALWYRPEGAALATALSTLERGTFAKFEVTDLINRRYFSSSFNTTGTLNANTAQYSATATAADTTLDGLGMSFGFRGHNATGTGLSNGNGPFGPGFLEYLGIIETNNPKGFLHAQGVSQGGKTLNEMLEVVVGTPRGQNALKEMLIQYISARDVALGGNGTGAVFICNFWGHNECINNARTGFCLPAQAWTVATPSTVTLNGGIDGVTTTIVVNDTTGLSSAGGHILIDSERIKYTGFTGNTLNGVVRGFAGTTGAAHSNGTRAYGGYIIANPVGFATDLYFFYTIALAGITANTVTCTANDLWFGYCRPMCASDTLTTIADTAVVSTFPEREFRFRRYAETVCQILQPLIPNFVFMDPSLYTGKAEGQAAGEDNDSTDQIHNHALAYNKAMNLVFANHMFGQGSRSRQVT